MMKTRNIHLIILIALAALFCGNDHVQAQEAKAPGTNYTFNLTYGQVRFHVYKTVSYYDADHVQRQVNHVDGNTYTITTNGVATTNRINIETKNLYSGATNTGCTYNIILDNVIIDRRSIIEHNIPKDEASGYLGLTSGLGGGLLEVPNPSTGTKQGNSIQHQYYHQYYACFDAGDGTVDVNIYLKGHNEIRSGEGVFAALQYHKWCSPAQAGSAPGFVGDTAATFNGEYREGKLRFLNGSGDDNNPGTLLVTKEIYVNSGAAIGGAFTGVQGRSGNLVFESGKVTALTGDPRITYNLLDETHTAYNSSWPLLSSTYSYGAYGAAIGGGGCSRCGNITINGGTVTARSSATASAIGGGGGQHGKGCEAGRIEINGGTVNAYCRGNGLSHDTGVGIGGGSGLFNGGADAKNIVITGGTITAYKWHYTDLNHFYDTLAGGTAHWEPDGHIGGGNSNVAGWAYGTVSYGYRGDGGNANITITGGNITAGSIGGGIATRGIVDSTNPDDHGSVGGNVNLTINMTSGSLNVSGKIGGGNSWAGNGGSANITIVKGTVTAGSIGAGDSTNDGTGSEPANYELPPGTYTVPGQGTVVLPDNIVSIPATVCNGGTATVNISGGLLTMTGKIGGGSSAGSGNGGNASIYVTGGTLDCASIGGGDTGTGTPGMVASSVSGRAGVHIEGSNKIVVKSGFIGGGSNAAGTALGKATAYINATHAESTIQGQFILSDAASTASDHCYFTMLAGIIDNTDLGTGKYVMARPEGGAVYIEDNNGTVNISGGVIQNSEATKGGAIYANGGTTSITGGILQYNHATSDGGAIYANGGTVTVNYPSEATGIIQYNSADEKGGALYISSTGRLNLYGKTTLKGNHVPFGKYGGGVYLEGIVQAGNSSSDEIKVAENYADVAGSTITDANRNNIYLPNPTVNNDHKDVITVVNNGLNLSSSSIGFSVPDNYVPVIYCSNTDYLKPTLMNSNAVFEDSHSYQKFYSTASPYNANYIYLAADTWVGARTSMPAGFSISSIDSPDDLAWLISTVNGLNGQTATTYSGQVVKLTADIDMSAHSWVPIGINGHEFQGEFNGNGHTITGIHCSYIKGSAGTGTALGLFGTVNNASIHDVFVDDSQILVRDQTTGTYSMGTIANEAKGSTTIYNCSSNAYLEAILPTTTMGGLVGILTGGEIHSSWTTAQMKGGTMGGIVGTMSSSTSLKNSFANVKFTYEGSTQYVGGLVSTNTGGTVENCYVREQDGSNAGSNFGWVVGNNSSGTITYCYIPDEQTNYKAVGTAQANNCTTYGETATPYLYLHEDNQMAANANNSHIVNGTIGRNGPKGLVATLNDWVGSSATYSKWMRTCASPINGDYPVFKYTNYECLASTDNIGLEYAASFNKKFDDYVRAKGGAGIGTIYLYQTPAALTPSGTDPEANVNVSNYGKATKLYIHEDVALKPASVSGSKATGDIEAYVGITLDNSAGTNGANPSFGGEDAIDWHFFSSALTNSPIGLHYGAVGSPTEDNSTYNAYEYPDWHATFTNINGYFPLNLNDYYTDWDLYAYYEPDYHWVNYKRNSASHWHEDWPDIPIPYTNHTNFQPGYGYMVALKEEGYLQAYGTLNTHTSANPLEVDLDYTPGISWTTRQGHNLLGNPYQSYLDFNKFAEYNSGLWENSDFTNAGYVIMDEDQKDYIYYHYDASANTYTAPRYLHPHQGFMVIVNKLNLTAKFDDRMRNVDATGVTFRDGQPRYPLVNLFATDDNGNRDMVTVELGRPDKGGALKQGALRTSTGSLCCHYEGEDYALVFTQPGLESANIRFSTDADAAYTMTWDTQNGEFGYLHLVDNLTGADIDCLTASEYKFTSRTSDYASRFKLVFEYTGIEEQEDAEYTDGPTAFAYYANGEIHLTGTPDARARLQIIDMTGRTIVSRDGVHTVSTTGMAAGVYVLRLTDGNGTRTQKIILN